MIRSSNPTSWSIYLKEIKSLSQEDTSDPLLTVALFTMDNSLKKLRQPLMGEWIKKLSCIFIQQKIVQSQ